MGRRRRKKPSRGRVQRRLPAIYDCPACGKSTIKIEMDRDMEVAKVYCGACKISKDIKINPLYDPVDAFGDFVDQYHKEGG